MSPARGRPAAVQERTVGGVSRTAVKGSAAIVSVLQKDMLPFLQKALAIKLAVFLGLADNDAIAAVDVDLQNLARSKIQCMYKRYFVSCLAGTRKSAFTLDGLLPQREFLSWSSGGVNKLRDKLNSVCNLRPC